MHHIILYKYQTWKIPIKIDNNILKLWDSMEMDKITCI